MQQTKKWRPLLLLLIACGVMGQAEATVTQVDGTIIPVPGSQVQAQLDIREGSPSLDAVLDAAELPEVFLPNTAQAVTFTDFAEFAGFENSFGYYNVGDDIFSANGRKENLHPVLGCGVPMLNHPFDPVTPDTGHHHGDPTMYIQDANQVQSVAVDFASEQAAGRYKGGFIGFYLITPQNNPSSENCGDFIDDGGGNSRFGFIYHTQKDLNDDGDFVHHLVYTSPTNADLFYFAFEDLFRGGDNDFADMMIEVDGLAPPCIPGAEVCDGLDNDCDGLIDAADPDLFGVGDACLCDDVALTCADGPTFGVCQEGQTICVAAAIECTSINGGSSEVCDLLDNDCNNAVDDNPAGIGIACDGFDLDLCPEGVTQCTAGVLACNDLTGNIDELCNNFDDDCDVAVDENIVDDGGTCGSSVGSCSPGIEVCVGGVLDCQGETGPSAELCDGLDNNCNAVTDDDPIDDGGSCGATDVGPCQFGTEVCVAGALQCVGEIGPQSETCNTIDDNCNTQIDDNPIDVGSPCGSSVGVCEPGLIICTATGPECSGETTGSGELCNSLDDDCNGVIDDNPTDVDQPCGINEGSCEPGLTKCINGGIQCVGGISGTTETCNGIDDNCDGNVDEGDLCQGGECINGECTSACDGAEFSCPVGQICESGFCITNPCFGIICPTDTDGTQNICDEGVCVAVCTTIDCPNELVCRKTDGFCVPNNCGFLPLCSDDELCKGEVCEVDPCFGVECASDQFCRQGDCFDTCSGIDCDIAQECIDGTCEATGCLVDCPEPSVCSPTSGDCIDNPCLNVNCPTGEVCDPQEGACVDDPCIGVVCPGDTVCDFGGCFDPPEPEQDAGPAREYVTPGGGGGCSTGNSKGSSSYWLVLAALLLMGLRKARLGAVIGPIAICAIWLQAGACTVNPFCINCEDNNGARFDGGGEIDATQGDIDAGADAAPGCEDGIVRQEICNELDDDCDGRVDEAFSLTTDFFNCGVCGNSCEKTGTRTECVSGGCEAIECFPGNIDSNGDIGAPFDNSDGCEYSCFVSNGGVEACDTLDNDCDGDVDEDTDFDNDDNNCGQCGRVCSFFQASGSCGTGSCSFDSATDCNTGFIDTNMTQADGCEYNCTPSNGGVEVCNLVDEDCDGDIDEDFDTQTNILHCGQCNRVCTFPNATPSCSASACVFNPATDCAAGFHDINGVQADGCEYSCTPSNGGVEICDLVDNDCNGVADDNAIDTNIACNNGPLGIPTGACTDTGSTVCSLGILVCVGAPVASPETCNDTDDDCNGQTDENITQACYTGTAGTELVGLCTGGLQTCTAGNFSGACVGEVIPATSETCDNQDEDCDGQTDEALAGGPIVQVCYGGTGGTEGVGECVAGTQSCTFGVFGSCQSQVVDSLEICGDGLDSDCDNVDDATEGCLVVDPADQRIDANGALGTSAGAEHSFDLAMAAGGSDVGDRIYAAWSDLSNGNSDIYFARSLDGGGTWQNVINLTGGLANAAVKPVIVVAAGATDDVHISFQSFTSGVRDIRVVRSSDSGASFTAPSSRLDGGADSFHHHAAISPDGTLLAMVWEELNTTTLARNIISRVSTDSGATFQAQRTINVGSGGSPIAGRPQVAVTSTDRFVYVWREIRGGVTSDVFSAFSNDATTAINLTDEIQLDTDVGDQQDIDLPLVKVVDQAVYVTWQNLSTIPGAGSDIVFVRSIDNGATYSSELIIDDPAAERSASFTPTIDVDPAGAGANDDRVFIAWEDRREGTQVFASVSSNGGQNFSSALRVSSNIGDPIDGVTRRPQLVYAGNNVVVVAYVNDDPGTANHVYVASSIDAGASWSFSQERLDSGIGNALNPVITRANDLTLLNGACVGWNDFRAASGINGDPFIRRVGQ